MSSHSVKTFFLYKRKYSNIFELTYFYEEKKKKTKQKQVETFLFVVNYPEAPPLVKDVHI